MLMEVPQKGENYETNSYYSKASGYGRSDPRGAFFAPGGLRAKGHPAGCNTAYTAACTNDGPIADDSPGANDNPGANVSPIANVNPVADANPIADDSPIADNRPTAHHRSGRNQAAGSNLPAGTTHHPNWLRAGVGETGR
jgi:hypothetical protein